MDNGTIRSISIVAAASLGLKGTVAAGVISTVSGRGCEHSLTTTAKNAGLIEGELETVSLVNVGNDVFIGGGSAGVTKIMDYVVGIAGYFNLELDMHVRLSKEALSRGELRHLLMHTF